MAVYLCHEQPDLHEHAATCRRRRARAGSRLDRSAFHPGGGGQVSDAGWLEHAGGVVAVTGVETDGDRCGTCSATMSSCPATCVVRVDADQRFASRRCTPTRTSSTRSCSSASRARS